MSYYRTNEIIEVMNESELYHYGVKGMKWGVTRSREKLSSRVNALGNANKKLSSKETRLRDKAKTYEQKSTKMKNRNSKYESIITKASAKKAKYDLKLQKQQSKRHPNEDKISKYATKSAKYNTQIMKAEKNLKYNKWAIKAEKTQAAANKAKTKIEKNERIMKTYNSTISALDAGTIKRGRLFMQYVYD